MKFILLMVWLTPGLNLTTTVPLQLGPFETEKLCVDAAAQIFAKWKTRYVGGDFLCIPTAYEREEK